MTVHLRGGDASIVVAGLEVRHWGSALSEKSVTALADWPGAALLPLQANGHQGRPGLRGHRDGRTWSPSFEPTGDGRGQDEHSELTWWTEFDLHPSGILRLRHGLRNDGATGYRLDELIPILPLPARATELLDFTGRWGKERQPQRQPLNQGSRVRESRRGRPGHDSAYLLAAGTPGFSFDSGEVWAVHLGWSGNQTYFAERLPSGDAFFGAGELLLPGELELAPGEEYRTPWLYAAYSAHGLNGISAAFHEFLRPAKHRPVVVNTWEATYFDHDLTKLRRLAERAAQVGVERFVLDDGWFRGRRDDTAGLGDWYVDDDVWPEGLEPLISHVRALGMDLGLWVEPEMVNADSDLFRAHPDWVLHAADRLPPEWRHQQVLDLSLEDVYAYLLDRLDALLSEYDIAYLKWDHNRDLVEPGHFGRAAVHAQTSATYRLIDELRSRHPQTEIESCASGGARVDLGILERTDRVWTSDSNDALERRTIQRYTNLLLPLELTGAHVGPPRTHVTGRTHGLGFRAGTALFGSFGVEWDLTEVPEEELDELATWIARYKRFRPLLHSGRLIQTDHPDPAAQVTVVLGEHEALVSYAQLDTSLAERPAPVRIPGLKADARYRVEGEGCEPVEYPGQLLSEIGLRLPRMDPETLIVLHVTEVS
ncbi:alpha-galactosidase [Amycolatopsis acidicola]|uniref:alpha-galactosidase n=1 Tax=Amycolatopsis acidicola TaxID=2596893 RepID=A0A5N0UVH2_9PSEU|nr:alpha-galactosidase [Amycolatopsis acidicola]KAA9154591.1 alpha-galactosidase [Amycolatopsis acidicola]